LDPLTNPAYLLFAAVAPILIAFLKQDGFSNTVNALIAFVAYVVIGILGAIMSGTSLTLENLVPLITIATVVGTAAYSLIWNNLGTGDGTSPSLDSRVTTATSVVK